MEKQTCGYDYAHKCDCSEDDKCGCTYPNNIPHDFDCDFDEFMPAEDVPEFKKAFIHSDFLFNTLPENEANNLSVHLPDTFEKSDYR